MYEYHGWATIRPTFTCDDWEDVEMDLVIIKMKEKIREVDHNNSNCVFDLRPSNGAYHLWIAGFRNHKPIGEHNPINFLQFVAHVAPGSYGILYIHDDEDPLHNYAFRVYVMRRGQIVEQDDTFLSPVIPTVEDECF